MGSSCSQNGGRECIQNCPSGRYSHRWEDNIRMYLKEIGVNVRNWVDSVKDRDYRRSLVNVYIETPGHICMELII